MSLEKRYFNITTLQWVRSYDEPGNVSAPTFGYKDNRDVSVQFLQQLTATQVEIVPDIVAVQIGLANGASLLTSATATAPENNHFPFVIPIVGANVDTLMSGKTTPQSAKAEFKLTTGSGTNRYYTNVFIAPQINADAVPDPAVVEPATTMSEVMGVAVPKDGPAGGGFIMRSPNGTAYFISVGDDGLFHPNQI